MDEPSAALSAAEVERLIAVARRLRDQGRGVIYISHRLDEVFEVCDSVTIMRDGATVATAAIGEIDTASDRALDGRPRDHRHVPEGRGRGRRRRPRRRRAVEPPASSTTSRFHVRGRRDRRAGRARRIGPVGGGARDLRDRSRRQPARSRCSARRCTGHTPAKAMAAGIALVPEDRRLQGLFMPSSIAHNTAITVLGRLRRRLLLRTSSERKVATDWAEPPAAEVREHRRPGRATVRRQPAEGRAVQVAGDESAAADRRRAHARASTSAPRPRSIACCRSRPPRASPC